MEERYVFREIEQLFDKTNIINKIRQVGSRNPSIKEGSTITLLIMGHGRERYKEVFKKEINRNPHYYSDPFKYVIQKQETKHTIRILSKAGKPKVCAWDYSLCSKNPEMSSQDIILRLCNIFFNKDTEDVNTYSIMETLSSYFKTIYPKIIDKISVNYRDYPEDKNPGSPDAQGYEKRFDDFTNVLNSLEENRFSQLKSISHEKIFTIRPDTKEVYEETCERYHMEIIEFRTDPRNQYMDLLDFITQHIGVHRNLVENYHFMQVEELHQYIDRFNATINAVYSLPIDDYERFYLIKFVYKLYFGNEILISEIVECFTILGVDTINIIDNTCRVKDTLHITNSDSPTTYEIEEREKLTHVMTKSNTKSKSRSKGGTRKLAK
jgi:hypothetical protein